MIYDSILKQRRTKKIKHRAGFETEKENAHPEKESSSGTKASCGVNTYM